MWNIIPHCCHKSHVTSESEPEYLSEILQEEKKLNISPKQSNEGHTKKICAHCTGGKESGEDILGKRICHMSRKKNW